MTPWKDQLRLGWRIARWMYWPENQQIWANAAHLIVIAVMMVAIIAQIWLGLLAAFFLAFAISHYGRKGA